MTKTTITESRLRRLLQAYGADAARWPQEERQAVVQVERNAALQPTLDAARRLDRELARLPRPQPASHTLHTRLMALAERPQHGSGLVGWLPGLGAGWTGRALAGEAATLAMALAAGLWLAASNLAVQSESMDLSPYVLGGELALLDEGTQ